MSYRQDWIDIFDWLKNIPKKSKLLEENFEEIFKLFIKVINAEYPNEIKVKGTSDYIYESFSKFQKVSSLSSKEIRIYLKILLATIEPFCKKLLYSIKNEITINKGLIFYFKKLNIAKSEVNYNEAYLKTKSINDIQYSVCNVYLKRNAESHGSLLYKPEEAISIVYDCINILFYLILVNKDSLLSSKSIISKNIQYSRVFPPLEEIKVEKLGKGEYELLKFLDQFLQKDKFVDLSNISSYNGYLIFSQPYLNGLKPDIVLLHPKVGMQIIEVKNINLNLYRYEKNNIMNQEEKEFNNYHLNFQNKIELDPIKQVENYKKKIISFMIPEIGESIDENYNTYGAIKCSIYFHNHQTQEVKKFFSSNKKFADKEYFPLFGNNHLNEKFLTNIVPDSKFLRSRIWKQEWNKMIFFWLLPPKHTANNYLNFYDLDKDQKRILEIENSHIRIRGVAGSGKSTLLANIAAKSLSQGKKILLLSFNITLWHFLKDYISRTNYDFEWRDILFNHFHGFCSDIINKAGLEFPIQTKNDNSFFEKTIPDITKKALEKLFQDGEYAPQFDMIILDEGQDFCFEYYELLLNFLKKGSNSFIIALDKKQNIYNQDLNWLDLKKNPWVKLRKEGKIKFNSGYEELIVNYRMPLKIKYFAETFANDFSIDTDISLSKKELSIIENPVIKGIDETEIVWDSFDSLENAFELINRIISNLINKSIHPSDIVILLPTHKIGLSFIHFMSFTKYKDINHVFTDSEDKSNKKSFWMGDGRLKACTIHSFKGWEVENVILIIPEDFIDEKVKIDRSIFTAITRSKQKLFILNSNPRYKYYESVHEPFKSM